jgi:molecular chaperone DnaK (HSP70)
MGTHGMKGMQKLFGSNAMKVITSTAIPFVVIQQETEAKQLIKVVEQALIEDGDILSKEEKGAIQAATKALSDALLEEDRDHIKDSINELNQLTTEFAHKRIQKYI